MNKPWAELVQREMDASMECQWEYTVRAMLGQSPCSFCRGTGFTDRPAICQACRGTGREPLP